MRTGRMGGFAPGLHIECLLHVIAGNKLVRVCTMSLVYNVMACALELVTRRQGNSK